MNTRDFRNKLSKKLIVWTIVLESIIIMQGCLKSKEFSKESSKDISGLKNMMNYVVDDKNNLTESEKSNLIEAIGIRYIKLIRQEMVAGNFENAKNMLESINKFFLSTQDLQDLRNLKNIEDELNVLVDIKLAVDSIWTKLTPEVIVNKSFGKIVMVSDVVSDPSNAYYVCFKKAEMIAHSNGLTVSNLILLDCKSSDGHYRATSVFLLK